MSEVQDIAVALGAVRCAGCGRLGVEHAYSFRLTPWNFPGVCSRGSLCGVYQCEDPACARFLRILVDAHIVSEARQ